MREQDEKNLAFELGFDWNVYPIQGVRDGVFPLQMALVEGTAPDGTLISPYDGSVRVGNKLSFRIYDFTATANSPLAPEPSPQVLQVLFTSAVDQEGADPPPPFSPVKIDGEQLAQLTGTIFVQPPVNSVAFGSGVRNGWDVELSLGTDHVELCNDGRFTLRALLTVSVPGQMARFYRADPEMVIGGDQ